MMWSATLEDVAKSLASKLHIESLNGVWSRFNESRLAADNSEAFPGEIKRSKILDKFHGEVRKRDVSK